MEKKPKPASSRQRPQCPAGFRVFATGKRWRVQHVYSPSGQAPQPIMSRQAPYNHFDDKGKGVLLAEIVLVRARFEQLGIKIRSVKITPAHSQH